MAEVITQLTPEQLQQIVQNAVAEARAALHAPPPVKFAVAPSFATQNILDYSTESGSDVYYLASEALRTTFSLDKPNLNLLLHNLGEREIRFGWTNILTITVGVDTTKHLLKEYYAITREQVEAKATAIIGTNDRNKQNDFQLFVCLMNSVDGETGIKMADRKSKYTINNEPSGILLLKTLLVLAEDATKATGKHL